MRFLFSCTYQAFLVILGSILSMSRMGDAFPTPLMRHCSSSFLLSSIEPTIDSDQTPSLPTNDKQRRRLFHTSCLVVTGCMGLLPQPSNAVVVATPAKDKVFVAGQALGIDESKVRFQKAKESLQFLLQHYDDVVANGGGDNIRRYLGTVGWSNPMYGITKVMKELQDEASDIVEYTENMNDFDSALRNADGLAYSANFVEYSAAKTKPETYFADAKKEVKRMIQYMDTMGKEINLQETKE